VCSSDLHSTYKKLFTDDIIIYDSYNPLFSNNKDRLYESCDHVFVATPLSTHFQTVESLLNNKINVFCEKPLTSDPNQNKYLYELADSKNVNLFIDWIYIYNEYVWQLKNIVDVDAHNLLSITMNRNNKGPIRTDTNARYDLACHDVSIINFILQKYPTSIKWIDYKRNKSSITSDSCIGLFKYDDIFAQINCSWEYPVKDRTCIFEFKNKTVVWDDKNKTITTNGIITSFIETYSPLENSIIKFIHKDLRLNRETTHNCNSILNHDCQFQ
jgi:predicted dehydrogenase